MARSFDLPRAGSAAGDAGMHLATEIAVAGGLRGHTSPKSQRHKIMNGSHKTQEKVLNSDDGFLHEWLQPVWRRLQQHQHHALLRLALRGGGL